MGDSQQLHTTAMKQSLIIILVAVAAISLATQDFDEDVTPVPEDEVSASASTSELTESKFGHFERAHKHVKSVFGAKKKPLFKIPKPCPICPVGMFAISEVQVDGCPKCAKPKFTSCKPGCFRGEALTLAQLQSKALPPCFCPPKRNCLRCPMCPVGQEVEETDLQQAIAVDRGCPKCRRCKPIRCPLIACARPLCPVGQEIADQDELVEMEVQAGCPRQICPRRIC